MKNTTAAAAFRFLLAALIADRDDRKYRIYSCRDKARLPIWNRSTPSKQEKSQRWRAEARHPHSPGTTGVTAVLSPMASSVI